MARKPIEDSVAKNCLKYGVGGINIDECRVGNAKRKPLEEHTGRFPANTILTYDESDFEEVCGGFPNTKGSNSIRHNNKNPYGNEIVWNKSNTPAQDSYGFNDSGSASRYFYCAKASKKDRDEGLEEFEDKMYGMSGGSQAAIKRGEEYHKEELGLIQTKLRKNTHPTVKPTELMQYLIRLVTPNGGTILDPFNGSGSTGKAAMYENRENHKDYKYIGIELTEEYLPISKARIEYVCNLEPEKDNQMTIFDFIGEENE